MMWDHNYEGKWAWHSYTNKIDNKTPEDYDYLTNVEFPEDRATAEQWVRDSLADTNCPFAWLFSGE